MTWSSTRSTRTPVMWRDACQPASARTAAGPRGVARLVGESEPMRHQTEARALDASRRTLTNGGSEE